jgi:hypothetical protein
MKWAAVATLAVIVEVAQTLAILFVLRRRPLPALLRIETLERAFIESEGEHIEMRARVETTERRLMHIEDDVAQQRKELGEMSIELRNVGAEVSTAHRVIADAASALRADMLAIKQAQAQSTARLLEAIHERKG